MRGGLTFTPDSTVALGPAKDFTTVSQGSWVVSFDAPEVTTALAAAGTLVDGQLIWCVLKISGDVRLAVALTYRRARTD